MNSENIFLKGELGPFDAVVTFSSAEHSGLGRYGDGLNPWGDMIAIARGWRVTKKRGSLIERFKIGGFYFAKCRLFEIY
jgi:hypothetical protein